MARPLTTKTASSMYRKLLLLPFIATFVLGAFAQDSAVTKVRPRYNKVGGLHRMVFGENYRREWSEDTRLPYISISAFGGGLKPVKIGGGHQTKSLRLVDSRGNEWVLRTIVKDPSILLPPTLRQTFARDVVDDAMSAQHPFSPLVVSDLAEAAGIPHATPVIGIVQHDELLGQFNKDFEGQVCLLEEREPFGNSDNTAKMLQELEEDNDNDVDGKAFLRAMLLDLLIGDWDRHQDQWRWVDTKKGRNKLYVGVPRDRDQAFYVNEGIAPWYASRSWMFPNLQGFKAKIPHVKFSLMEHQFLTAMPASHMSEAEWMNVTNDFVKTISDDVIDKAMKKLPASAYEARHEELAATVKARRDNIPAAMREYYRFLKKVVDIKLSNKNELVTIRDTSANALTVTVNKLTKSGKVGELLAYNVFKPSVTKEIRIYEGKGNDSIIIDNSSSKIKLRLVGNDGVKRYSVLNAARKVKVYDRVSDVSYKGKTGMLTRRNWDDTSNINYGAANRYNILMPLLGFAINRDDGLQLGVGSQYTHQGFRKYPYASLNRFMVYYSFATSAFRIKYTGEWLHVFRKTDVIANADIHAPENTQNFFGLGNETEFHKTGDFRRFYRARFNMFQLSPALRWRNHRKGIMFSAGPSLQHYRFDSVENKSRFILNNAPVTSYDSNSIAKSKTHGGVILNFSVNRRNSPIIPTSGYYFNVRLQAMAGLSDYAKSFGQLTPEFIVYQKLNAKGTIVLADRIGGGVTLGKAAFYQSLFAGGHGNLLGYRQYRFAGEHLAYNNFELRLKIANFTGYIIPGQFGITGFYDVGRVWVDNETSSKWHSGAGGGLFFAPAQLLVINVVAGYSNEGWLPYVTMGFRF